MSARESVAATFGPLRSALRAAIILPLRTLPGSIRRADRVIRDVTPFTPVLGLARSLLAVATLATLLATPSGQLFFRSVNFPDGVTCDRPLSGGSLFCLFRGDDGGIAITIAVVVLVAVISGFFPAATALPHWWVAWSFNMTSPIPDGGDQVSSVLTLLLIPVLLGDRRRNHWRPDRTYASRASVFKVLAYVGLTLVWVQVCVIYFHAAVGKFPVEEWANGTVLWYWFHDPTFAPAEPLRTVMLWIVGSAVGGALLAYGSLATELLLALALFAGARFRAVMLIGGGLFHLGIAVSFGLWSFSTTMLAALLLYLVRPSSRTASATDSAPHRLDPGQADDETGDKPPRRPSEAAAPPKKGDDLHAHDLVPTL